MRVASNYYLRSRIVQEHRQQLNFWQLHGGGGVEKSSAAEL
jgi:hypothetical protein